MSLGVFSIVEGHGDVEAVRVLIRSFAHNVASNYDFELLEPMRISRGKILDEAELGRAVQLANLRLRDFDVRWLFAVFDSDDECPVVLATAAHQIISSRSVNLETSVVIADKEFESWFLCALDVIRAGNRLRSGVQLVQDSAAIRDAKGYFERNFLPSGAYYSEAIDQARFSSFFNFNLDGNRSFEKLKKELGRIFFRPAG